MRCLYAGRRWFAHLYIHRGSRIRGSGIVLCCGGQRRVVHGRRGADDALIGVFVGSEASASGSRPEGTSVVDCRLDAWLGA